MLVALSSAGMMMLALMMRERTGAGSDIDVSRVIQGLVTGVGFIGAGAIMREGVSVYGITTAASLWVACALGIMVGLDAFMLAVATTIVATLLLLIPVHYHGRSDDNGGAPHPLGR
jgi:putative Mg2+ transporter-C (MgtC) family protein